MPLFLVHQMIQYPKQRYRQIVQNFGASTDVLVRLAGDSPDLGNEVAAALRKVDEAALRRLVEPGLELVAGLDLRLVEDLLQGRGVVAGRVHADQQQVQAGAFVRGQGVFDALGAVDDQRADELARGVEHRHDAWLAAAVGQVEFAPGLVGVGVGAGCGAARVGGGVDGVEAGLARAGVDAVAAGRAVRAHRAFASRNVHGTGCTLSSAIAAHLALGYPLAEAVALARTFILGAIAHGADVTTGHGHGPLNHGFAPLPLHRITNPPSTIKT